MDMVVLSTSEVVSDLLDQRSAIYSDKVSPRHPNASTLVVDPLLQAKHSNDRAVSSQEACDRPI